MMSGGTYHPPESGVVGGPPGESGQGQVRNPLTCFMCEDYYSEPCLLTCYHTFCARCLRGRDADGKMSCPLCGQHTVLKEGCRLPPADFLMRQLIVLANAENPPCANCDKRDKSHMYFCSTCGQALCKHCRENTHSAKMFSSHDVMHMSKCSKESHRRCGVHGEQYIMFSTSQKSMLCVNCFRDTPAEARLHCVDIDTAYTQDSKKLDRAVGSVRELQGSVREGLLLFKSLLDELRRNMDTEKLTINNFCQGMQEAIAKTHANMIMEVQRQFETKERQFRGQLMSLGTVLPLLQLHLNLCTSFLSSADKYQFLDMVYPMMDRLAAVSQLSHPIRPVQSSQIRTNYRNEFAHSLEPWVGTGHPCSQPPPENNTETPAQSTHAPYTLHHASSQPSRRQQSQLRAKALEGEGPFSNHCRSFDTQLKELSQQLCVVKERLNELHRDVRRAHTPPLSARHDYITRECAQLEEQLERHQVELERLKNVFDTLWEEQLCRIHVEQEIFQSQMSDILTLRSEVKHLSAVAHQLEPYVKSLSGGGGTQTPGGRDQQTEPAPVQPPSQPGPGEIAHHQLQSLLDHITMLQLETPSNYRSDGDKQKGECRMHPGQVTSPTSDNVVYMRVDSKDPPVRDTGASRGRSPHGLSQTMLDGVYVTRATTSAATPGVESKRGVLSHLMEKVRTKEDRKKSPVQEEARTSRGKGAKTPPAVDEPKQQSKANATRTGKSGNVDSSGGRYLGQGSREGSSKVASLYHTISGKVLCSRDAGEDSAVPQLPPPPPPASMVGRSHVGCLDVRERLETHLKDKIAITRHRKRQNSTGDHSEATSPGEGVTRQAVRALVHREQTSTAASTPTSPQRRRAHHDHSRMYPASDTEDSVFYAEDAHGSTYPHEKGMSDKARKQSSCESLTLSTVSVNSRRSSVDLGIGDRKTFVVLIGTKNAKARLMQKQRSWETFPPKRRDDKLRGADSFRGGFDVRGSSEPGSNLGLRMEGLKKADSFEGHEEAVRTLVAAVQETRSQMQQQQRKQSQAKPAAGN